jgi:CRISPR-associated endonuclease Csn1
MKKILGLDLGVSSIGWALIDESEKKVLGIGSRIIPLSTDDKDEFTKGNAISKNQKRTLKRTQRKGYDRYQLRRQNLISVLKKINMLPDDKLIKLTKHELWKIRSDAITEKLSLQEIGRVLLHLNQKRGYKSSRSEANLDKKDTEYIQNVKNRHEKLKESGLSIGQSFYNELTKDENYRIKEQVFPREAYVEEYNSIMKNQQKFYPEKITDEMIAKIRDEIIYFQRKLKSQKGLVSVCEFEGFWTKLEINGKEKELFVGPKVAPKSSPLFQVSKIWETINNIILKRKTGDIIEISQNKKNELFEYMDNHEKLTYLELLKILNVKKDDVYGNKQLSNGLQGNRTKIEILKCFDNAEDYMHLFNFDMTIKEYDEEGFLVDKDSGEIVNSKKKKQIKPEIEEQTFYKLWHTIYSISYKDECKNILIKKFKINEATAIKLSALDFTKQGFGNKSHRAMRKILPYLMEGEKYSSACSYAGYNHSSSLTKEENFERKLLDKLRPIEKNSLRQPIVEKVLNQMINVVNAIIDKYGKLDEIRIELARELKQSRDERNETFKSMRERERENKEIEKRLAEYGLRATRNNIIKWRLYHEIHDNDNKQNAICIYCGNTISLTAAMLGEEVEVEHIIPRSKVFDDSQSNKTLAHRKCNANKKDQTAFDYMHAKSEQEFIDYIERINTLYKNHIIGKTKRDKLLMPSDKIPNDFIERQLRETQYISRKTREILHSICYNVWATSGNVTSELRYIWGWNDVLMNLQLPKYRELDLTENIEINENGNKRKKEIIKGWSKRDDHRHHAIDALTIACTKQGFIQRFNKLNSSKVRNDMMREIEETKCEFDKQKNLLENYISSQKPFTTNDVEKAAQKIFISFKPGKKVATIGKRKVKQNRKKVVVQKNIIVPRGALSEESIYGRIKTIDLNRPIKYLFENPNLIFKPHIKTLVEERLYKHNNDIKSAVASLKKEPIYLDDVKKTELKFGTCYKEEIVIKYPLGAGQGMLFDGRENREKAVKIMESVVDKSIREKIMNRLFDKEGTFIKPKEAFKDLENNPLWFNEEKKIPIKTVRCFTGLTAVEPVKKDENGNEISFVKPGNNHHLAIYRDEFGNKQISLCSFWHAVERKKYGFPIVIKNPLEVIDKVLVAEEDNYPDSFLEKLPDSKWIFLESFQQNEMFVFDMSKNELDGAISNKQYEIISKNLYRVQKLSSTGYFVVFRHHLATSLDNSIDMKGFSSFENFNGIKVSVNILGQLNRQ